MKDLITIFNYSSDTRRKQILHDLILDLQDLKEDFDILVVSHSSISDITLDLIDYFYYDKNNELLTDFDLTNKFWFRSGEMAINSSIVYPFSTHLAIYSLFYYAFSFAFHRGYSKIHFIEFDINLKDINLIREVNQDLDENDGVMFQGSSEWTLGVYFASTTEGYTEDFFKYNKEKILDQLKESDSRMTERITPVILCKDRKIKFREYLDLNENEIHQKSDQHQNESLKWAVPLIVKGTSDLNFFVYNEEGGSHIIDIFFDNNHIYFETSQDAGIWNLIPIGDIHEIDEILIFVDKVKNKEINFKSCDRQKFMDNNFVIYLNDEN